MGASQGVPFFRMGNNHNMGSAATARRRKAVWAKSGGICWLCKQAFNNEREMTLDHVIERSKDGSNAIENLEAAHRICNEVRSRRKHPSSTMRLAFEKALHPK